MTKEEIDRRVRIAMENHCKGYNCAQSVTCAFSDLVDMDEETLFKITEGLGLGMGGMEGTCGAISAAAILSGLTHSTGNLAAPNSKAESYKVSKQCMNSFKEKNGSLVCRDLKGVDTKKVLRSCNGCIEDATTIIAESLFSE